MHKKSIGALWIYSLPPASHYFSQGATLPKVVVVGHDMRTELPSQRRCRRRDTSTFDWFKTYQEVSPILNEFIPDQTSRVLILGCGNSALSEDVSQAFNPLLSTEVLEFLCRCTTQAIDRSLTSTTRPPSSGIWPQGTPIAKR